MDRSEFAALIGRAVAHHMAPPTRTPASCDAVSAARADCEDHSELVERCVARGLVPAAWAETVPFDVVDGSWERTVYLAACDPVGVTTALALLTEIKTRLRAIAGAQRGADTAGTYALEPGARPHEQLPMLRVLERDDVARLTRRLPGYEPVVSSDLNLMAGGLRQLSSLTGRVAGREVRMTDSDLPAIDQRAMPGVWSAVHGHLAWEAARAQLARSPARGSLWFGDLLARAPAESPYLPILELFATGYAPVVVNDVNELDMLAVGPLPKARRGGPRRSRKPA